MVFIGQVAHHESLGGGPTEAFIRLIRREHTSLPLDQTPILSLVQNADKGVEFVFRLLMYLIPDVNRYDLTNLVAEGFNISGAQLFLTSLVLGSYLLFWLVLSFYLIRAREVAA
jgi:hypothetical protein